MISIRWGPNCVKLVIKKCFLFCKLLKSQTTPDNMYELTWRKKMLLPLGKERSYDKFIEKSQFWSTFSPHRELQRFFSNRNENNKLQKWTFKVESLYFLKNSIGIKIKTPGALVNTKHRGAKTFSVDKITLMR